MKPPRILVLTPTLGRSPFLDRTLASVADQPVEALHVLCAPAGRRDELERLHPGVRVVPDAGPAGGIYGALNAGLAHAAGEDWEWFTYINDDDALLPGFGRMALRQMAEVDPAAVAYGDVELVDERDRVLSLVTVERDPAWIPALLQQGVSPLMQQGMLVRRDAVRRLGGFDTRYRLCADLDFWVRAYASGERFRHHSERVGQFRLRSGQLSADTSVTRREQDDIVARHLPARAGAARRNWAVLRYRASNLPRYLARARSTRSLKRSYRLLEGGAPR